MKNYKLAFSNYFLLLNKKRAGDASVTYSYEENNRLSLFIQFIPYPAHCKGVGLQVINIDNWEDKKTIEVDSEIGIEELKKIEVDNLNEIFNNMFRNNSPSLTNIEFEERRRVYHVKKMKDYRVVYEFMPFHENDSFLPEGGVIVASLDSSLFTRYPLETNITDIVKELN